MNLLKAAFMPVLAIGLFLGTTGTASASNVNVHAGSTTSKTSFGNGVYCGDTWESCEVDWGEYTQKAVDRAVLSYSTALSPSYGAGGAIHDIK